VSNDRTHVPTVEELALEGLAHPAYSKTGAAYKITPKGQTMIDDALRHNAAIGRLEDEARYAETRRRQFIWEAINGEREPTVNVTHEKRQRQETYP